MICKNMKKTIEKALQGTEWMFEHVQDIIMIEHEKYMGQYIITNRTTGERAEGNFFDVEDFVVDSIKNHTKNKNKL